MSPRATILACCAISVAVIGAAVIWILTKHGGLVLWIAIAIVLFLALICLTELAITFVRTSLIWRRTRR